MENILGVLVAIVILAIGFLVNAGLVWVVCWAFGWTFTWKVAIGFYVIKIILKGIFTNN